MTWSILLFTILHIGLGHLPASFCTDLQLALLPSEVTSKPGLLGISPFFATVEMSSACTLIPIVQTVLLTGYSISFYQTATSYANNFRGRSCHHTGDGGVSISTDFLPMLP